ncbi:MAG: efflux RND transporter permease subunit [Magnetococcales bacterium]|nr:efflux RND transporter permease subunit [Magnetococcales bacterium]
MLSLLYKNHVFANVSFFLILVIGMLCYGMLPRQQDPDMNFNWISILTLAPGTSAEEVEKQITDPLEEALQKVANIHFVLSSSRESTSEILVRFDEMDERLFDKRVNDLRREIQNKRRELPEEAEESVILEITSSNGFPTVMVVVQGQEEDENLRLQARHVKKSLERISGVDQVTPTGLRDPEVQVSFSPPLLASFALTPMALADTLTAHFRDVSAGTLQQGPNNLLVRLQGSTADLTEVARWPVLGGQGEQPLGAVANVGRGREKAHQAVRFQGKPAVLLAITKRPNSNALALTRQVRAYVEQARQQSAQTGVTLWLANDSTFMVQHAIGIMENNAMLGLLLVLLTCWLFLGSRIALLVSLGIPFSLAAIFAAIYGLGGSLNVMVLLGVVIALGMLVDDAVVVVETIYGHLQRGKTALEASVLAMREVAIPVITSVLTTMAAFLPLMLLPGILGKFMRVIPMVVSGALAVSLVEAFWMLPAHVVAMRLDFGRPSRLHPWRTTFLQRLRRSYMRLLLAIFRWPKVALLSALLPMLCAAGMIAVGWIRVDFFAMDPMPLFYVNVKMPPGTTLSRTLESTVRIETQLRHLLHPGESQALVSYAGLMFTETQMLTGDRYGQILVSLTPEPDAHRPVPQLIDLARPLVATVAGPESVTFMPMSGGPPVTKPIHVKVRGDDFSALRAAVADLKALLAQMPEVTDISDNFAEGGPEWRLRLAGDPLLRADVSPATIARLIRLLGDGEVAAHFQHQGEKINVRVLAEEGHDPLQSTLPVAGGGVVFLKDLLTAQVAHGPESLHHFNFRRAITIEAELDKKRLDVVTANERLKTAWSTLQSRYPGVELDFTGILDDIYEAMDAIGLLFVLGLGLMYLILGAQFHSYFQPILILTTVPMAFTGVAYGTLLSGQALSLYTLYGVVALSGIAVNSSIVLIAAANDRRALGWAPLPAILYAARRRLIPILITSVTTIAGLFSLAVGLGGYSLLWGPVATAIVWGLGFSTLLTLLLMPLLYWLFARRAPQRPSADTAQPLPTGAVAL